MSEENDRLRGQMSWAVMCLHMHGGLSETRKFAAAGVPQVSGKLLQMDDFHHFIYITSHLLILAFGPLPKCPSAAYQTPSAHHHHLPPHLRLLPIPPNPQPLKTV